MDYPQLDLAEISSGTPDCIPVPEPDFWVFAYGSLMWNPGFDYIDAQPAILFGYHRRLCLWSTRYRGTVKQPGLVLGLDRGGCCQGYAYLVDAKNTVAVVEYLCDREMLSGAYEPRLCPLTLSDNRRVSSLAFVSKQDHPHFVTKLSIEDTVAVVGRASGARGCNRSYVLNTVTHMNQMDIQGTELHRIADRLQADPDSASDNNLPTEK